MKYLQLSQQGKEKYSNDSFNVEIEIHGTLKLSEIDLQCIIDSFSLLSFKIINLIDLSCRSAEEGSEDNLNIKKLYEKELNETNINRLYGGKTIKKYKLKKRKNKKTKKRKNNLKNNKKTKRCKRKNKKSRKIKY